MTFQQWELFFRHHLKVLLEEILNVHSENSALLRNFDLGKLIQSLKIANCIYR